MRRARISVACDPLVLVAIPTSGERGSHARSAARDMSGPVRRRLRRAQLRAVRRVPVGHGDHRRRDRQLRERHGRRRQRRGDRQRSGLHAPRHRSPISTWPVVLVHLRRDADRRPAGDRERRLHEQVGRAGSQRPRHARLVGDRCAVNGIGIAGVAPDATLVALKACTVEGSASPTRSRPRSATRATRASTSSTSACSPTRSSTTARATPSSGRSCRSSSPLHATHSSAAS